MPLELVSSLPVGICYVVSFSTNLEERKIFVIDLIALAAIFSKAQMFFIIH